MSWPNLMSRPMSCAHFPVDHLHFGDPLSFMSCSSMILQAFPQRRFGNFYSSVLHHRRPAPVFNCIPQVAGRVMAFSPSPIGADGHSVLWTVTSRRSLVDDGGPLADTTMVPAIFSIEAAHDFRDVDSSHCELDFFFRTYHFHPPANHFRSTLGLLVSIVKHFPKTESSSAYSSHFPNSHIHTTSHRHVRPQSQYV